MRPRMLIARRSSILRSRFKSMYLCSREVENILLSETISFKLEVKDSMGFNSV
jgi:hypothetical protein